MRAFYLLGLAAITILGAVLRWQDLAVPSLWLDEILHLRITQGLGWRDLGRLIVGVREIQGSTENGSLYYVLQMLGQFVAPGDLGARLLPATIGTASVPVMALVAQRLSGSRLGGVVAASLLAVAPLHVYFSREGRPYYLTALFSIVLIGILGRAVEARRWGKHELLFVGLACLAGAYSGLHALPLFVAASVTSAALWLMLLWSREEPAPRVRSNLKSLAPIFACSFLLLAGLYLVRSEHNIPQIDLSVGEATTEAGPTYDSPLSERSLRKFAASMTTAGHPSTYVRARSMVMFALALLACVALGFPRTAASGGRAGDQRQAAVIVLGLFGVTAAVSLFALVSVGRWYGVRYTSAALPAFLILVTLGILVLSRWAAKAAARSAAEAAVIRAVLALGLVAAVVIPNWATAKADPFRKLDWRELAAFVDNIVLPGEPILVADDWPTVCLGYYLEQRGRTIEFIKIWNSPELGETEMTRFPRGWLVSAGHQSENDARAWIHRFVPVLKRREEGFGLFYFPNQQDLLTTREAAGKGDVFSERFDEWGRRFDFGGGEVLLQGRGWSYAERAGDLSFQWAVGDEAQLAIPYAASEPMKIELRARAFTFPGADEQRITLVLNDTVLGEWPLPGDWTELRAKVPSTAWVSNSNVLRLQFARANRPIRVLDGAADRRPLAGALDWLRLVTEDHIE